MGQKKLVRFAAIKTFANVLEYPEGMQGKWHTFFKNSNPIVLELACGRGEYTVGLSKIFANKNFIGVDIKGNRIFIGAKNCLDQNLQNAAFLRTQIERIAYYFNPNEVSEIWLTFPDPQLRTSKAKKRLTHPRFLRMYQQVLSQGGYIHLKTDSPQLYHFTKKVIDLYNLILVEDCNDVALKNNSEELKIVTHYQQLDIAESNTIFYLKFQLPTVIKNIDDELQEILIRQENLLSNEQVESFSNKNEPIVFSEKYLVQRGYCCGNGCVHCPYGYKAVPEPKRSELLAFKKEIQ